MKINKWISMRVRFMLLNVINLITISCQMLLLHESQFSLTRFYKYMSMVVDTSLDVGEDNIQVSSS